MTMDLLSEASSGGKVLSVRHISAEKSFPKMDNETRTMLLCHSYSIQPDFGSYLAALSSYSWVLWTCGLLVLLIICVLYVVTMKAAMKHWRECITNVAVVLSVYPIVAAAAFLVIVVPRSRIIGEAIAQEVVMIAVYHLYCMMIAECGGPEQLVRRTSGSRLETRVLPCCCWPCCVIPRPKLKKQNLEWIRYLILQMPVIQAFIYVIVLVIWSESMDLYHRSFMYFQPFIAASILSGVWGIIMCVRALENVGHKPRPRFLALQLVLLIVKLQCSFAKVLSEMIRLPCIMAMNPIVFVHMIQNSVMMLEMLALSLWAWRLYRVPPGKCVDRVQHVMVAVLDDNAKEGKKDGIENMSFNKTELK